GIRACQQHARVNLDTPGPKVSARARGPWTLAEPGPQWFDRIVSSNAVLHDPMTTRRFDDTVAWFETLGRGDIASAGGKGANLGELTRAGMPVPPGFVVTAAGYLAAMDDGGVREGLRAAFADALRSCSDPAELAAASATLR